jgi:peptidoglycan/LPS O-acetylase OafA/YrhL
MWARNFEFMLGVWLVFSPFIFQATNPPDAVVVADFACGAVVCIVALVAYWPQTGKLHLLNGVIGAGLVAYAFMAGAPPPPYHQNHVVWGLLVLMICIVPNRADEPPRSWQEFYDENAQRRV